MDPVKPEMVPSDAGFTLVPSSDGSPTFKVVPNAVIPVVDPVAEAKAKAQLDVVTKATVDRFQTGITVLKNRREAMLNRQAPAAVTLADGKQAYMTAPVRLKRMLDAPLGLARDYSAGPGKERVLHSGWGEPRPPATDGRLDGTGGVHDGLDYAATYGETVAAAGDGDVVFVGYQALAAMVQVPGVHQSKERSVLNAYGNLVAKTAEIGYGGIFVAIQHDGDFTGYQTRYFHLSEVSVKAGDHVTSGAIIGKVGNTGAAVKPHLHFTLLFGDGDLTALVNPTAIVPNYWPNNKDSTNTETDTMIATFTSPFGGQALVEGQAAAALQNVDRSTALQNQDREAIANAQADHARYVALTMLQQQNQLTDASALFQEAGIVVMNAMTFDFETGVWIDGTNRNRPV